MRAGRTLGSCQESPHTRSCFGTVTMRSGGLEGTILRAYEGGGGGALGPVLAQAPVRCARGADPAVTGVGVQTVCPHRGLC